MAQERNLQMLSVGWHGPKEGTAIWDYAPFYCRVSGLHRGLDEKVFVWGRLKVLGEWDGTETSDWILLSNKDKEAWEPFTIESGVGIFNRRGLDLGRPIDGQVFLVREDLKSIKMDFEGAYIVGEEPVSPM